MNTIAYIMSLLDWHKPSEVQETGRQLARDLHSIEEFLQPTTPEYSKNVWDNCASILSEKTDEELSPYLIELLEWLCDMNWPGAICIMERLQKYSDKKGLDLALETCLCRAKESCDDVWTNNLLALKRTY